MKKYYCILGLMVMVVMAAKSGDGEQLFGNILDVSWRLPEPQGAARSACERDIQDMYTNLRNMTLWAYEMWDASARAPIGLLQGNQGQYGNWEECVGEQRPADRSRGMPRQYCTVVTYLESFPRTDYPDDVHPQASAYNPLYISNHKYTQNAILAYWGVCAPASCEHTELSTLLQDHFHNESLRIHAANENPETVRHEVRAVIPSSSQCQKSDEANSKFLGSGSTVFFAICGLSVVAVTVATFYDWITRRKTNADGKCPRVVKALSLIVNMQKLSHHGGSGELAVLNGLKVIGILLIILAHHNMTVCSTTVVNRNNLEKFKMTYNWLILFAGEFMVENFFVMSAILTSYNLLKKEPGSPLNFPRLIFGRYSRLFPAYIMTILFSASVLPILGSGPFWKAYMLPIAKNCEINWWTNLLMVNNYVNIQNLCISVSWYLGCDFQFFLLSLSVLWLLRSWPKAGLLYLGALLLASILVPAVIAYNFVSSGLLKAINIDILDPTTVTKNKYFEYIYAPSHTRAGPYLVGLLAGYLLVKREKSTSKSLSMKISISATVAAAAVLLGIIYVRYLGTFTNLEDMSALRAGLVTGLQKHVWALATTVIILCCTLGQVPVVTSFLSWSAWVPLGNLTYGVVLIHVTGEYLYFGNQRTSYYFNIVQMIGEVAIITIYSYLASLLLHLFIEAPFWRIIDILFPGSKPKRS